MIDRDSLSLPALRRIRIALALTHAGMAAERFARAFWPAWTLLFAALAGWGLGLAEVLPPDALRAGTVAVGLGLAWSLWRGLRRFRWPSAAEAVDRLDRSLPGRPFTALVDSQAIGAGDTGSEAVWSAHVARMARRVAGARAIPPDPRLAERDTFGLRAVALTLLLVAVLFGTGWRGDGPGGAAPGGPAAALAAGGPAWEGWVEPPAHTGLPSLYLNDIAEDDLAVPVGSRVTLRFYGEPGALGVDQTVSSEGAGAETSDPGQAFDVARSGRIRIDGPDGRAWRITATPDAPPVIAAAGEVDRSAQGEMRYPFTATDDYGVVAGRAEIELDLAAADRRHGLTAAPEPRAVLVVDLPLPISGDRRDFGETLIEDFSKHPWANLPVTIRLVAEDALGQTGTTEPEPIVLPGRRFFDPLAAALVEQRRDLLWSRENLGRVLAVLRAVTHRPEGFVRDQGVYLQLRQAIRQLASARDAGTLAEATRDEVAEALWQIALQLEDGDLADALERLRRAEERLSEAIRNGASDAEIEALMQELAEAMGDYMRQLAERSQGQQGEQSAENSQPITGEQLQQMMDEIERLMQEGRMAEAQALLDQLMQMMQNLQVTEGGEGSEGQRAMDGLGETLRDQQDLSDEAFGDLQDRFNRPGQDQGQDQGRGQQGEGQADSQQGQGNQQGMGQGQDGQQPGGGEGGGSLADRQEALRRELERQQRNMPGAGTEQGQDAREALDRAGRAMDEAEQALRDDDLAGAIDSQANAMEALREGMRSLGEALAQERIQQGEQGQTLGQNGTDGAQDPLGRNMGNAGRIGTAEDLLQGEDVYRRAEDLLDEIRRRSGDKDRPEDERDYLERLLDQF